MTWTKPTILGPGEGERIGNGPAPSTIVATRETTNGGFTITDTTIPPGFPGPPPHSHRRLTDSFYVLEGILTVHIGDEVFDLEPGAYACVPPNNVHTFSNRSASPARFLNINAPAGWEEYLRAIAHLMKEGPPTADEWRGLMARFDFVPAR